MKCINRDNSSPFVNFTNKENYVQYECRKYGMTIDATDPFSRECIEEDNDVLWRAARCKKSKEE